MFVGTETSSCSRRSSADRSVPSCSAASSATRTEAAISRSVSMLTTLVTGTFCRYWLAVGGLTWIFAVEV
ncbi:hypothetical protein HRbin12_01883 [bacterium HR12]|nr:hypothetical protein HRbin12_01883 [bacterium HR12]